MKIAHTRWMKSKWFKIGVPIAIIVLSAALYTYWSVNTWNNYQTRFTGLQNEAQSKIKDALGLKIETSEERTKKLDAFQGVRDMLPTDKDSLCQVNKAIDWQNFIGNLHDQKDKCNEVKTKLVNLRSTLDKVIEYLKSEHALAKTLGTLPAGGEVAEGDWTKQRDGYEAVLKNVSDLPVSGDFTPVKQAATEKLTSTVAAWEEVLAAHGAKDKARYTKAVTTLATSYDGLLTMISKASYDHLQVLLKSFEESYAKL